ncbi:nuclear transport factor 2 family protein [Erythrobacter mangrovi]|uniref:nuclear transport factor 2 family protein n=1 Tax=Erythrobacter mangrovi TaxID=2739433 RepID=UPI0018F8BABE|nr:nuclear transport factor 2 family protein [Erythrobacter mangrovi]
MLDALQTYFDALYECDVEALRRVFHPRAIYVCPTGEDLVYWTMDEYFPVVEARTPPAARGEIRRDAVEAISFAGPKTAFARVRCSIGEKYFTDFLTLILDQGRWRIISKVFHFDLLPEEDKAPCHT